MKRQVVVALFVLLGLLALATAPVEAAKVRRRRIVISFLTLTHDTRGQGMVKAFVGRAAGRSVGTGRGRDG